MNRACITIFIFCLVAMAVSTDSLGGDGKRRLVTFAMPAEEAFELYDADSACSTYSYRPVVGITSRILIPDTDMDGVADSVDLCPYTPLGCIVDKHGCPSDADDDGICNGCDKCPNTPRGLVVDFKGCPVAYTIEQEVVLVGVTFPFNSSTLSSQAKPDLDQVVESLKALKHIRVEIQGYTDNRGDYNQNMALSLDRARSVAGYFISQGISESRLVVKGYGPNKPKYDNGTAQGRRNNCRVSLLRLN